MKKILNFGKIDYMSSGKKSNAVEIKIELKNKKRKDVPFVEFSASANVWNHIHTNICMAGQCLDELVPHLKGNETFDFVYDCWKKYHLNGMNAGTIEQENALKEAVEKGVLKTYGANNYEETCNYLKEVGLYKVEVDGEPYRYGTGWLVREIPAEVLEKIEYLIETGELMEDKDMER